APENPPDIPMEQEEDITPISPESRTPLSPLQSAGGQSSGPPPIGSTGVKDPAAAPPITITKDKSNVTPSGPNLITPSPMWLPIQYDPEQRLFTLPESDPLDKAGPPPKKWKAARRQIRTLGGGSLETKAWVSDGEIAVPLKAPADFVPGYYATASTSLSVNSPGISSALQGLMGLSSAALGMGGSSGITGTSTSKASLNPAPIKRVKKVKSDIQLDASSGIATPSTTGNTLTGRKKGTGQVKRTKKSATGTATPTVVDTPLVTISKAVSDVDTEMQNA
ncbi:11277_t:CDS:1, partial [Acaulospora colombiana]